MQRFHANFRLSIPDVRIDNMKYFFRGVVVDFEKWLKARKHQSHQYPSLTKEEKDLAVRAFLSEDKPTNLMSAINVFEIKVMVPFYLIEIKLYNCMKICHIPRLFLPILRHLRVLMI